MCEGGGHNWQRKRAAFVWKNRGKPSVTMTGFKAESPTQHLSIKAMIL
jgi:hypothetical protein